MYCRPGRIGLVAIVGLLVSCARQPSKSPIERIAILRFENLGADPAQDWMGRAFSEVITAELAGSPAVYPIPSSRLHALEANVGVRPISSPGISAERTLAILAGAQRVAYGNYAVRAGHIEAALTVEDLATRKMPVVVSVTAGDVISVATGLARGISDRLRPYNPRDTGAMRAYCVALEASDPTIAAKSLEEAIAADPDFGKAYTMLAQLRLQRQDRTGALSLLESARARTGIGEADRARIEEEIANLRNDLPGRRTALTATTRLEPANPGAWRSLAEIDFALRDHKGAVQAYSTALTIEPEDINSWNQLGYAAVYAGDLPAAMAALRRYQTLRPADANPLDSMGDVNLLAGRLREAEEFYVQAGKKDPGFQAGGPLFKAAVARLMSGDVAGADALARQYHEARAAAHDPFVDFHRAEWSWLSGKRKGAIGMLEEFARGAESGPSREVASRAYGEAAIWRTLLGDRAGAGPLVQQSIALAGQSSAAIAAAAKLLAEPDVPLEQVLPNLPESGGKDLLMAYRLLTAKDFAAASVLLQRLFNASASPSEPMIPLALAWTLIETGKPGDAAPLVQWNPIIQSSSPFVSFYFPRLYYLRAEVARSQGKTDEARANYDLFLKLSGPDPLIWGEEAKSRSAR